MNIYIYIDIMYVYICICIYICIYIGVYIYIYIHYAYIYTRVYICIYTCAQMYVPAGGSKEALAAIYALRQRSTITGQLDAARPVEPFLWKHGLPRA